MITTSGQPASRVTSPSPFWARALAAIVALGGTFGCSTYSTYRTPPPTGCYVADASTSPAAGYEFKIIDTFEGEMGAPFFTAGDLTPGAAVTLTLGVPPIGAPCGSATALEIHSAGFNDWGSLIGYNNFGPKDASAYEGVSFWAHPGVSSNKAFTMLFDDPNTYNASGMVADGGIVLPMPPTADCTKYPTPDGGAVPGASPNTDPATGMVLSSGSATVPLPANGCGNQYQAVVRLTDGWQLTTVPFGDFQQLMTPNEVTGANPYLTVTGPLAPETNLITSRLMQFAVRFPKAMGTDIWIDNLAFYRHKGWVPSGRDGGVDASQM
jgi:hypothetical protein